MKNVKKDNFIIFFFLISYTSLYEISCDLCAQNIFLFFYKNSKIILTHEILSDIITLHKVPPYVVKSDTLAFCRVSLF